MNCAHLENCLHEAREEARTNKCSADRRVVEYDALRSSALRIHGLFERLNNCITAPGVTGFAESLHSLAASLASSVKKDEAHTTVQFQQCIKILADKVYLLTRQSAELLERYSAMQAVHGEQHSQHPVYIIGQIVHIERRIARPDQMGGAPRPDSSGGHRSSASMLNPYNLPGSFEMGKNCDIYENIFEFLELLLNLLISGTSFVTYFGFEQHGHNIA
ncbi:hypothetical protein ACJX0J_024822, partial [Zea mays]